MVKKHKKGFTIVELVVVIAVIAILAAVLIPTFVNLVHKAEFSNDQALVRNINTTLAISAEGTDGKPTMYDTLVDVQENGFVVENLTPRSSGSDIVWDEEHNQFVLVYENGTKYFTGTQWNKDLNTKKMWKIYTTMPISSEYSIYLAGTNYDQAVAVSGVGFDAGRNTKIPSVKYTNTTGNAENVTIRTNGYETDLIVDDETTGTIYHHGVAGSVEIIECHTSSFHEYGKVAFAEISKGRIVLEGGSEVNHIHVNAKEDDNGNKLDEFDTVVIAKAASVDMPDLSRDDVDIAPTGTLVVALQEGTSATGEKDYVWLTKQGVFEQITISDNKNSSTSTTGVVWANDASVSETNQTAAQQIANNIGRGANGAVSATVTVGETEYTVTLDATTRELVVTNTTTGEAATGTAVTGAVTEAVETPKTAEEMKEEAIAAVVVNITTSVETLGDGETFQLVATGSNLVWSSSDSDVATVSQTGLLTANGAGTVTITVTDGDQVKTCDVTVTYFHAGTGSENDQFIIANRKQLSNTGLFYYKTNYYFKVMDGITEIDCSNWDTLTCFSGTLDGNGVTLSNLDAPLIYYSWDGLKNTSVTYKNMNINCNMHYNDDRGSIVVYAYTKNTIFDNVNVSGLIESSLGCSAYVGYGAYGYNYYYFNNCVSNVTLVATGGAASGFVNHPGYSTSEGASPSTNAKIFITDSIYNGRMSATGSSVEKNYSFKYFVVNSNGLAVTTKYSSEFVDTYGNPEGLLYGIPSSYTENDDGSKTFNAGNYGSNLVDYYRPADANNMKVVIKTFAVTVPEKGEAFTFAKLENATKVVLTLEIGANDENGYGNYVGTYEVEEINVSSLADGATVTSVQILNFNVVVVPANNTDKTTGADGSTYYVVSGRNGSTYGSAIVRVTQYDTYGNVLGAKAVSIAA